MATGANVQPGRGNVTTRLAPTVDLDDGSAAVWSAVGRAADQLGKTETAIYKKIATRRGAEVGTAVAAGEQDAPRRGIMNALLSGSEVYAARQNAYGQAYLAGTQTDFDAKEAEVRRRNAANPEGYEREMQEVRSGFIQGADPQYAVDVEQYAQRRSQAGLITLADQAARVRTEEANTALVERMGALEGRALGLIDQGNEKSVEFEIVRDEYEQILAARVANPVIPYSQEEADNDLADFSIRGQARATARYVGEVAETQGAIAALDEVARLQADPDLDPRARPAILEAARDAANSKISDMQRRNNIVATERNAREAELTRLIDEDVAGIELSGEGTGLTQDNVYRVGGNDTVVRWLKKRADAYEFNNLVGNLPLNDPDAAAEQIRRGTEADQVNFSSGFGMIADDGDFATLKQALIMTESNNVNGLVSKDPDGAGGGGGGAYGLMQILPSTAETVARSLGIRFDQNNPADLRKLRYDARFNQQIGDAHLRSLIDQYDGDSFLAITAYHAGTGNVNGWLRSVGDPRNGQISREDWLEGVERRGNPLSAEYPRKVLRNMRAGRADAAWEDYSARRTAVRQDPASYVQTDFAVRAAREEYQKNPNSVTATEGFIRANMSAQERMNIKEGDRTTLPGQSLALFAGDLERYARAGDTAGFQAYSERIVRRHGRYGQQVLQDALELRGDSRWAAIVSARASADSAAGRRPAPTQAANARSATRSESVNRASNGTQRNVNTMSIEELNAAAGL